MAEAPTILVVEDDPDVLYLACKHLAAAGFSPIGAHDGVEALRRIVDYPDCRRMVTDFSMPFLDGPYWMKVLERFCPDWTIVVVSSADVDPGPFTSIPKPVDYENLIHIFDRQSRLGGGT
jgi:CheY-like chemotaxis protein